MKIKFNWGTGIFTFIILFIITMIGVIVFSFNQQVNLVTPEYYPKGVIYEEHIAKIRNTSQLKEKISYKINDNNIVLSFPKDEIEGKINGTVQFYYVIDFEKDYKYDIKLDKNLEQKFSTNKLYKGRYILKIDWENNNKKYYQEIDLNL